MARKENKLGSIYFVTFPSVINKADKLEYNKIFEESGCFTFSYTTYRSHIFFAPVDAQLKEVLSFIKDHGGVLSIQESKDDQETRAFISGKVIAKIIEEYNALKKDAEETKMFMKRPTRFRNITKKFYQLQDDATRMGELLGFDVSKLQNLIKKEVEQVELFREINTIL